jgi:hypothetical protein
MTLILFHEEKNFKLFIVFFIYFLHNHIFIIFKLNKIISFVSKKDIIKKYLPIYSNFQFYLEIF